MIRSSSKAKGTIKDSKEGMETRKGAGKEGGHILARILVVDDDEVECRALESLLVGAGHQVESCLSGQEAMARLKEGSFDLVITEVKMPGVDGLDVLRKAKELDPSCEVIVITAYASVESAVEVMRLGAYDYISKPFNIDEISIVIDKALEKRRLVRVDGLTEVYDYRGFDELLEAEIARSERHPRPLSVLMIGLDDLEVYNDTLEHPAGNVLLREAAWLLRKSVRRCDVVARYREDGFAVILVEANKIGALSAANRLGRLLEETSFEHDDLFPHRRLTISIGVAGYPTDAGEKAELVTKADQALSEAKMAGGNLVRSATQALALTRLYHKKWLYFLCKRCMDIVLSLLFLIITLPLFLLIALLIKVDSPGPLFFKQKRGGLRKHSIGGQEGWEISTFTFYKFRTMYHNADQGPHRAHIKALARDEPASDASNKHREATFKLIDDPRVTRVGKVLRKTSLDELPQFLNVLRGEMSLVGPRPVPLYELAEYKEWHRERLTALAGITGFWQVKGRSRVPFDQMVRMDIEYIHNQSLWLDLKILLLTIPAVLSGEGAA